MKHVPCVLGAVGVAMVVYAVVGRFVGATTVMGWLPLKGFPIQAKSLLIAANSVLLLAILTTLCGCCRSGKEVSKE